jgi:ferredoxin-nitrite reductase
MVAAAPSQNKFEKLKAEKDGLAVRAELESFAAMGWEAMDTNDREHRLKWLGVFWRPVTPGKFMMRFRLPSGIITGTQLRVIGNILQRYGDEGSADVTTRQNIQIRGIRIEDLPEIFAQMATVNLTSVQSGMDNVRNITGSPIAGLEADELYDTRAMIQELQDQITNCGAGNPEFSNLPRKFNIAIEGSRDNSVHAEINDLAFIPAYKNNEFGFNIVVGGFFSGKRIEPAIPLNAWVPPEGVIPLSLAMLRVFRDHGLRVNRTKSRLMWLIDEWGVEKLRSAVAAEYGSSLATEAEKDEITWEKRDHLGVYAQKQAGLNYVGIHIPLGRLFAADFFELARVIETYGSGELRFTVEQNGIITNVPNERLDALLADPLLQKFAIAPHNLQRSVVSCTGAQFCSFALMETKQRAEEFANLLTDTVEVPAPVRIHWTGCPNSCGQPQVADIGLMGTKVRKDGRTLEGVDIYMGGKVGKDAHLGTCVRKGVPCEDLQPVLEELLVQNFGGKLKN